MGAGNFSIQIPLDFRVFVDIMSIRWDAENVTNTKKDRGRGDCSETVPKNQRKLKMAGIS